MRPLALALTLLAPRAFADSPPAGSMDGLRERVVDVAKTAADPAASPASVWAKGQDFFSDIPRTAIVVEPGLRGWDFGREALGDGRDVAAKELAAAGRERLSDLKGLVPAPDTLKDAVASASVLHDSGRLSYDPGLAAGQMGVFRYVKGLAETGLIGLNERLSAIAAVIGKRFAYATLAHEADHSVRHREGALSPEQVVEGEVSAFTTQYDWLVQIDPYGERLPYAHAALSEQIRQGRGGALAVDARAYLEHLAEVRATGRDPRLIRELVDKLGYREGHQPGGDGHAHPPRA